MPKKVIVFVDANNWYHNVKNLITPSEVDIKKLAEFLCKIKNFELIDIYWYASKPSIQDGEKMYYSHLSFLNHLEKSGIKIFSRKLQRLSNKEIKKQKSQKIDSLDLCKSCKPLIESVFLDLADLKKNEKGVDVWCAIDMIDKSCIENNCDACILISGDADFVPALNLIKKKNKDILVASSPFGFSKELRDNFEYFILKKETLMKCLRQYKNNKKNKK
ncbi:MAG: NYN domain-containing protein [Nanoarchaeota archaeon]